MMPRAITEIEIEYNKKFPGNPATLFYIQHEGEAQDCFVGMLRRAIDTDIPLTEEEIISLLGKEDYESIKNYLEGWFDLCEYKDPKIRWK